MQLALTVSPGGQAYSEGRGLGLKSDHYRGFLALKGGFTVATFYILPSRPLVGERLSHLLESWLPGIHCAFSSEELAEGFGSFLNRQTDSYIVFREDLPLEADPVQALIDGFGAEEGDEVIEVAADFWPADPLARRWQVPQARAA